MDIQSLRCFTVAAEFGSFTRAAQYLRTTQPNISKHVKRLEVELAAPLFTRCGVNVKLTNLGKMVFTDAKVIVVKFDRLKEKTQIYSLGEYGQLAVGCSVECNPEVLANIMSPFCLKHPHIEVSYTKKPLESDLLSALYGDELDVIVTSASVGLNDTENIHCQEIASNQLVLVIPKGHRFADYTIVRREDLSGEPIILFSRYMSPVYYDWITTSIIDKDRHDILHESDVDNILLKVAAGKGVSILSTLFLKSVTEKVHVVNLEYDRGDMNVNMMLSCKTANNNPSLALLLRSASSHNIDINVGDPNTTRQPASL